MAAKHISTAIEEERAVSCAERICQLRWASASEIFNTYHLGQDAIMPLDMS